MSVAPWTAVFRYIFSTCIVDSTPITINTHRVTQGRIISAIDPLRDIVISILVDDRSLYDVECVVGLRGSSAGHWHRVVGAQCDDGYHTADPHGFGSPNFLECFPW